MTEKIQLLISQGGASLRGGNFSQAEKFAHEALKIEPNNISANLLLSFVYIESSRIKEALSVLNKTLLVHKNSAVIHYNLGLLYSLNQSSEKAYQHYLSALHEQPNDLETLINISGVLNDLGRYSEALEMSNRAVILGSSHPECFSNKGIALINIGKYQDAIDSFSRSLTINSQFIPALINMGSVFQRLHKHREAIGFYDQALLVDNAQIDAWINKSSALNALDLYDEAIKSANHALAIKPDSHKALINKSIALRELGDFETSLNCCNTALSIDASHPQLLGDYLHLKMSLCDWSEFDKNLNTLITLLENGENACAPFPLLALTDREDLHLHASQNQLKIYGCLEMGGTKSAPIKHHQKIRVGYFSSDLREHPVAHLIVRMLEQHDKNYFEVFAFAWGPMADDPITERIKNAVAHFIDINHMSDEEVCALVNKYEIDIAIDLTCFTRLNRINIFAKRVAPIQMNFLGYPGTSGAPFMDYIIADRTLIPDANKKFFSEKIIYLPHSYQPNDETRIVARDLINREQCGLPENSFIFCCFNNPFKILPTVFEGWMRILRQSPNSLLWLYELNPIASNNLRTTAEKMGISPSRLVFAKPTSNVKHLSRFTFVDVFLDTAPYNAHTTASDALWSGVPLITLGNGQSFASRVAASLLLALDLPELIAKDQSIYEELAIELSQEPAKLFHLKEKLHLNIKSKALFNSSLFTKNIETAFKRAYEDLQKDSSSSSDIAIH
jgi:predicted O-linked N-acetylglucosamine transferase (SPINDLY family)